MRIIIDFEKMRTKFGYQDWIAVLQGMEDIEARYNENSKTYTTIPHDFVVSEEFVVGVCVDNAWVGY